MPEAVGGSGVSSSLCLLFTSVHEESRLLLPQVLCRLLLCHTPEANGPIHQGPQPPALGVKDECFVFITWWPLVFCHRGRKLSTHLSLKTTFCFCNKILLASDTTIIVLMRILASILFAIFRDVYQALKSLKGMRSRGWHHSYSTHRGQHAHSNTTKATRLENAGARIWTQYCSVHQDLDHWTFFPS